jgi:hypothetical protein
MDGGPSGAGVEVSPAVESRDDEISLSVYFETLWRYRSVILAAVALVCVLFAIVLITFRLRFPVERVSSVQFRLLFDGAAQNQYPNGTPFSPSDIIGAPVVAEVFAANDLKRFGQYEYFKQLLNVQQASLAQSTLAFEYQSKLADVKLTPVERAKIEEEFKNKREAMIDPVFALSMRRSERFTEIPAALAEKVLNDILDTWAQQADLRKGALRYQVAILSSKSFSRENTASDDYLITADLLRSRAVRIVRSIDDLEKLPGALTMRTAKDKVSLPEIRATLEDSIRFDIEPLLGIIRSQGVTKNAQQLSMYASNAAFQIRLDKEEIEGRARALQAGLREYMSQSGAQHPGGAAPHDTTANRTSGVEMQPVMPQLSESFIDQLQQVFLRTSKDEIEYRRSLTNQLIEETKRATTFDRDLAYYEDLAKSVKGIGAKSSGSPELIKLINDRTAKAFDLISKATDQLSEFYAELSAQNLGSAASLYVITRPFSQVDEGSLSERTVGLLFVLTLLVTLLVVPAGCLMHGLSRRQVGRPRR